MTCKMLEEVNNPTLPRERPPEDIDERLDWLILRHQGGRVSGCDWCLLVETIEMMQRRANVAEFALNTNPLVQLSRLTKS